MTKTSEYRALAADIKRMPKTDDIKVAVKFTRKHKGSIVRHLTDAMTNIEQIAVKAGVSQFGEDAKPGKVRKVLVRLARRAYGDYLCRVQEGATRRELRQFVKVFAPGRNRQVIKAVARGEIHLPRKLQRMAA